MPKLLFVALPGGASVAVRFQAKPGNEKHYRWRSARSVKKFLKFLGRGTHFLRTVQGTNNIRPPYSVTPIPTRVTSMLPEPQIFDEMIAKLQAGDDDGLQMLFERFSARLIGLASQHIASHLRHRLPPEDVVQSVFKSFIKRYRNNCLDIRSAEGIWGLLTVITVRKCADRIVHQRAACRDARREAAITVNSEYTGTHYSFIDRQPSPLEASILSETLEQLFQGLDPEAKK